MPGLGVMSLVEIDMVIRFQSDTLDDGPHAHDAGCLARNSFLQLTMPIITVLITIGLIAFQSSYMSAKDSLMVGLTFTIS